MHNVHFFTAMFHCFKEVLIFHSFIIIILDNVHLHMVHMCHVEPPRGGGPPLNFTPFLCTPCAGEYFPYYYKGAHLFKREIPVN